jgi:hypothetical protein
VEKAPDGRGERGISKLSGQGGLRHRLQL